MDKQAISIDYYPEGDMLSVTFGTIGRKGRGFELNENIYIRIDPETRDPLGLTLLSYSKLIKMKKLSLSFWNELSEEMQHILFSILKRYPVNMFLNVKKDVIDIQPVSSFPNTPLQELIAA